MLLDNKLEQRLGRALNQEEQAEIDLFEKGRALQQLTSFYGWDVVLEMLRSYAENSLKRLAKIDPNSREEVLAEHAVAFAGQRIYTNFVEDVDQAIEAARTPPSVVLSAPASPAPQPQ